MLAGRAVLAVQGVAAGDKDYDAARPHLVDGFCKEIVVDGKSQLVVRLVVDLVVSKGHIAHGQVVKISAVAGLKASNRNVGLRVQFLCDAPGDAVQLHAI